MKKTRLILAVLCALTAAKAFGAAGLAATRTTHRGRRRRGARPDVARGLTYSNAPRGFALTSPRSNIPIFFVFIASGMPDARGFWRCPYDGTTPEGELVYAAPQRVATPLGQGEKNFFLRRSAIFQDGKEVHLLRLSTKRLVATRWDGRAFTTIAESVLKGIPYPIASFDCIRRGKRGIELAILCHDGQSYRPETFKGDRQSYYDGAEIYRERCPDRDSSA